MRGPGRTILVVDDDDALRLLCRVNLELEGHRVLEARSLEPARATLRSEAPDVVLLDMRLGNENGSDLLDDLDALSPRPRVVLFTGTTALGPELRARADAVVPKPFALDDLCAAVSGEAARPS